MVMVLLNEALNTPDIPALLLTNCPPFRSVSRKLYDGQF